MVGQPVPIDVGMLERRVEQEEKQCMSSVEEGALIISASRRAVTETHVKMVGSRLMAAVIVNLDLQELVARMVSKLNRFIIALHFDESINYLSLLTTSACSS